MNTWKRAGAWLALGWACLATIGCAAMSDVEEVRDQAAALGARLEADAARWEEAAAALDPADPARAELEALGALSRAQASSVQAGVKGVDLALARAKNPEGMTGKVLEFVMPFVPAPARVPLTLGLAAVGAGVRAWQLRRGLVSVIRGIDTALREDGAFAERFKAHADTFRATQSDLAKRVVDSVAGRAVTARGA